MANKISYHENDRMCSMYVINYAIFTNCVILRNSMLVKQLPNMAYLGLLIMFKPADRAHSFPSHFTSEVDGGVWGAPMKEMMSVAGSKR